MQRSADWDRRPAAAPAVDDLDRRLTFDRLYELHARSVLAFALRRTASPEDAEDVAAETFIVAWRRDDRVPPVEAALPWLYGVARRVIANQRRASDRRRRLVERLAERPSSDERLIVGSGGTRALAALERLGAEDRELLKLVAWEGLRNTEIAEVLGITTNAVAIRLHRARRRYERALAEPEVKASMASRTLTTVRGRMFGSAGRNEAR